MMSFLKTLLQLTIDRIDSGSCELSELDLQQLVLTILLLTDKDSGMSKYKAAEYLNVSRATFDNYIREGKLPKGEKVVGFKELRYYKRDLDKFIRKCREQ